MKSFLRIRMFWFLVLIVPVLAGCPNPYSAISSGDDGYGPYPSSVNPATFHPGHFLIVGQRVKYPEFDVIKDNPGFVGIKKIYSWRDLEPEPGVYDFSEIERDLAYLQGMGKRLWLQVKETQYFAEYEPHVPEYMWSDPRYGCGQPGPAGRVFYGTFYRGVNDGHWVVCRGNEEFDRRHQEFYAALGQRFTNLAKTHPTFCAIIQHYEQTRWKSTLTLCSGRNS